MRRRKLLIGLMSAGAFTAGFGAAVFPASAQLRTITVTLLGGQTVTVQVDEPADGSATGTDTAPPVATPPASATPPRRGSRRAHPRGERQGRPAGARARGLGHQLLPAGGARAGRHGQELLPHA